MAAPRDAVELWEAIVSRASKALAGLVGLTLVALLFSGMERAVFLFFVWIGVGPLALAWILHPLYQWIRSGRRAPGNAVQAPVREREQPTCCAAAKWVAERDLGHARGFEFDLGRCERCGTPWMFAYCVASSMGGYEPISREEAEKLRGLAQPELAVEIRAWGDRIG